jgi:hypothetical protein
MAENIQKKTNPYFRTFLAGCSGVSAAMVVHPVDTIKIRMQL